MMKAIRVTIDTLNMMSVPEKTITGPNTVRFSITASSHVSQLLCTANAILDMTCEGRTREQNVTVINVSNGATSKCYCLGKVKYITKMI